MACIGRIAMVAGVLLAGCAGSVVVDHAVTAEVTVRDEAGKTLPGEVVRIAKPPNMSVLFDWTEYRDENILWSFGAADDIINRAPLEQCLHFDRAEVASNFHEAPIALSVHTWVVARAKGKPGTFLPNKKRSKEPSYFTPPTLCLDPGERVALMYGEDLRELFPNGRIYNTSRPNEDLSIADTGAGNWMSLRVPVTIGAEARTMDIKFTALDSKARISYY